MARHTNSETLAIVEVVWACSLSQTGLFANSQLASSREIALAIWRLREPAGMYILHLKVSLYTVCVCIYIYICTCSVHIHREPI